MTFKVILYFMKNFSLLNDRNIDQNRFIIECARKKRAKIQESHSLRVFFGRCIRTFVLNKFLRYVIRNREK